MKAAVISAPRQLEIVEAMAPKCEAGKLLVRVTACGICASNLPRWEGRDWFQYPSSPGEMGHEGVGRIVEIGAGVQGWKEGDEISFLSNHAYAEFDVTDAHQAVRIPASLSGCDLPGEPLACAWNIFARAGINAGDTIAIVGAGFLGSLLVQLGVGSGARVIVVTRRPFSATMARSFGADAVLEGEDVFQTVTEVERITDGSLCQVVIEATGKQGPLELAGRLTGERGRLVIAGYHQDGPRTVDMQLWNWRGIDVINAHERDAAVYISGMRHAFTAVQQDLINPRPLLTHHLPLDRLAEGFELLRTRPHGFVKATVRP